MKSVVRLAVAAIAVALAAPAHAQGGGGKGFDPSKLPKPEEIKKKAKEFLEKAPEESAELEGVIKITYKKIPTDPKKIAEQLGKEYGGGAEGRGGDIEAGLKMYQAQIQEVLNDVLRDACKVECFVDVKVKSKTIKKGSYKMGIEFDGDRPVALVIDPDDKKPSRIPLVAKDAADLTEVKFEVIQDKKKKEKFVIQLSFVKSVARSPECEGKASATAKKPDEKKPDEKKPEEKKPE